MRVQYLDGSDPTRVLHSELSSCQPDGGGARDWAGWRGGGGPPGERPLHPGHGRGGLCGRSCPQQTRSPGSQGRLQKVGRRRWILNILSFLPSVGLSGLHIEPGYK